MTQTRQIFRGGPIFDGDQMLMDHRLIVAGDTIVALEPDRGDGAAGDVVELGGDVLSPGFVDLQVNGGDGIMFNDAPEVETLRRMGRAHVGLGATSILPTLITDTAEQTRAAIDAAKAAIAEGVPGIAGLHLEGPHLSVTRKGAHSAGLIREMAPEDLDALLAAARDLPALMITVAPENVSLDQVAALAEAGAIVSLGHSNADFATCSEYVRAGARCVTHLFNAMSQMGNREPGLVGAALAHGDLSAGLIADAIHVHPATIRAAWDANQGPGEIFLVSDSMACAGSSAQSFEIDGRKVLRRDGRLTLEDGTLAGADLDLVTALRVMVQEVGVPLSNALRAATSVPAKLAGLDAGHLAPGTNADLIRITPDFTLRA
ncbi:N-acetylglucosamine-6-phosphate deacetylase [uncultured Pelagimonas sp.]|uniref:N-acetylglucosamine-6-phosphate deacetylase n=1 Tax=uncultured Pelagimonas sp. TaxID=1618102 RepID=UPI002601D9DD|nr:N-acetylglucosamine-6-phosphate deacetylase [uncultured Pelagimonas sp.]